MLIKYNGYYANFNLNNDSVVVDCKVRTKKLFDDKLKEMKYGYQIILNVSVEHQSGNLNVVYKEEVITDVSDNEDDKVESHLDELVRDANRNEIKKHLIKKGHMIVDHMIKEWKKDVHQVMDLNAFLGEE
jgi:hypothetical protein